MLQTFLHQNIVAVSEVEDPQIAPNVFIDMELGGADLTVNG
jgi:hypothetical protein